MFLVLFCTVCPCDCWLVYLLINGWKFCYKHGKTEGDRIKDMVWIKSNNLSFFSG